MGKNGKIIPDVKFVDLSHPITADMPIFPGDPENKIENAGELEQDGFEQHVVSFCTHVGTHVDAPRHMLKGGKNLDEIPLDRLIGRGVVIKTKDFNFLEIEEADIREGDIVLFNTGMHTLWGKQQYYDSYPVMDEEVATYLAAKRVKMVGLDNCSADRDDKAFPIHKILLKKDILIIENLTNVEALEGKEFKIYALPMKLQLDGAPIRVIAEVIS